MSVCAKLLCSIILSISFLSFYSDGFAEESISSDEPMYVRGRDTSYNTVDRRKSTFLGFTTGLTLPFVAAGIGLGTYELSDNVISATGVGLASSYVYTIFSAKVAYKRKVPVPQPLLQPLNRHERMAFTAGYQRGAHERLTSGYRHGLLMGMVVSTAFAICMIPALASYVGGS